LALADLHVLVVGVAGMGAFGDIISSCQEAADLFKTGFHGGGVHVLAFNIESLDFFFSAKALDAVIPHGLAECLVVDSLANRLLQVAIHYFGREVFQGTSSNQELVLLQLA